MAGTKRKADASRGSSSRNVVTQDHSTQDSARPVIQGRGTRSGRSRVISTATSTPSVVDSNNSSDPSKSSTMSSKEKTATEASNKDLKEPRSKRQKLSPSVEARKPTRSSARLKARAPTPLSQELPPRLSPQPSIESSTVLTTENTNDPLVNRDDAPEVTLTSSSPRQTSHVSLNGSDAGVAVISPESQSEAKPTSTLNPSVGLRSRKRKLENSLAENASEDSSSTQVTAKKPKVEEDERNDDLIAGLRSRKRKLDNPRTENASEDASTEVAAKKPKLEEETGNDEAITSSFQSRSTSGSEEIQDVQKSEIASDALNSPVVNESPESQNTEDIDNTVPAQNGNASSSSTRGRGNRGRGSGRGRSTRGRGRGALTRGAGRGRGRGGGRGGGKGGKRNDDDSDVDFERENSLSPSQATQMLLDRQKELKQNFKRLGAQQQLMLNILGQRTTKRIEKLPNHIYRLPEFEEVKAELESALHRREEILENQYRLRMEEADILLEAEMRSIQERFEANVRNIREEIFYAARGEYMALVEGVQHAEDDEHTEPDVDDVENEPAEVAQAEERSTTNYEPLYRGEPQFERGYNSRYIRDKHGAAAYERGKDGWDDFMQRAKMKEISQEETAANPLHMLLQASMEVFEGDDGYQSSAESALSALADVASNAQPAVVAQRVPMPVQPQPQLQSTATPTEHRPSFLLPPPPVSRPVLSSSHGLPDIFTTGRGPPQLPPPPGVTFDYANRPVPLSGFMQGGQHQQPSTQHYQPVRATNPMTTAPPYYFPGNPHPQPHQPPTAPPPPQTSSTTPHQRY